MKLLQEGTLWVREIRKVRVVQEKKISRRAARPRRPNVQKEMPLMTGIRLSALFEKEVANLGISVRSSIVNRLEVNQRNQIILWQSSKHGISPEQEECMNLLHSSLHSSHAH